MSWKSALFTPGRMDEKTSLFLSEARVAHDRITNLMILTYPLLAGVWQFRETAKHFASLSDPVQVRDAVLSYIQFPHSETAIRRLNFTESVANVSWERQRDSTAEMMFLVCCSIYENFTSHLQDIIPLPPNNSPYSRPIEKGFQFPSNDYNLATNPPTKIVSTYSDKVSRALSYLPLSPFMVGHICQNFPLKGNRNLIEDFELKMHTYLLFKKLRNSISHGRFDNTIPHQYEIVKNIVDVGSQGVPKKVTISTNMQGEYFVTLYDVIGFVALLLRLIRDIDLFYLLSDHGEKEMVRRLSVTREARQSGPSDRKRDLKRLQLCLISLGVNGFRVDDSARVHLISCQAWCP